jgi:peroxiredoxin
MNPVLNLHALNLHALNLHSTHGPLTLSSFLGQKHLVVYLMREFSCALCQGQVRRLKAMYAELRGTAEVLVVGGGSVQDAKRLEQQLALPFPVAADPTRESYAAVGLEKILGFWQKSGTVVIDKTGAVQLVHATGNPAASLVEPELRRVLRLVK